MVGPLTVVGSQQAQVNLLRQVLRILKMRDPAAK